LQNFLLFLILYLFYNANLLKIYNNIKLKISFIEFVNNINILIYKKLIKYNYKVLDKIRLGLPTNKNNSCTIVVHRLNNRNLDIL